MKGEKASRNYPFKIGDDDKREDPFYTREHAGRHKNNSDHYDHQLESLDQTTAEMSQLSFAAAQT